MSFYFNFQKWEPFPQLYKNVQIIFKWVHRNTQRKVFMAFLLFMDLLFLFSLHVKMWILIVKIVFYKYINFSAHNLIQIYTDMTYKDAICTEEQNQFQKHLVWASV